MLTYLIAILHANSRRSRVPLTPIQTFLHTLVDDLTIPSAEVIKIEHPTKGDDTRHWGPPYAPYLPGSGKEGEGESAYFFSVFTPLQPPLTPARLTLLGKPEQKVPRPLFPT